MEHPGAVDVAEAVREPLRFEQVEAIVGKVERLAASGKGGIEGKAREIE
jgi:hypothetical protein